MKLQEIGHTGEVAGLQECSPRPTRVHPPWSPEVGTLRPAALPHVAAWRRLKEDGERFSVRLGAQPSPFGPRKKKKRHQVDDPLSQCCSGV